MHRSTLYRKLDRKKNSLRFFFLACWRNRLLDTSWGRDGGLKKEGVYKIYLFLPSQAKVTKDELRTFFPAFHPGHFYTFADKATCSLSSGRRHLKLIRDYLDRQWETTKDAGLCLKRSGKGGSDSEAEMPYKWLILAHTISNGRIVTSTWSLGVGTCTCAFTIL